MEDGFVSHALPVFHCLAYWKSLSWAIVRGDFPVHPLGSFLGLGGWSDSIPDGGNGVRISLYYGMGRNSEKTNDPLHYSIVIFSVHIIILHHHELLGRIYICPLLLMAALPQLPPPPPPPPAFYTCAVYVYR